MFDKTYQLINIFLTILCTILIIFFIVKYIWFLLNYVKTITRYC